MSYWPSTLCDAADPGDGQPFDFRFAEDYPRPPPDPDVVAFKHEGVIRSTPKAKLVRVQGGEHWLPVSVVFVGDDTVTMPPWFARRLGLGTAS